MSRNGQMSASSPPRGVGAWHDEDSDICGGLCRTQRNLHSRRPPPPSRSGIETSAFCRHPPFHRLLTDEIGREAFTATFLSRTRRLIFAETEPKCRTTPFHTPYSGSPEPFAHTIRHCPYVKLIMLDALPRFYLYIKEKKCRLD